MLCRRYDACRIRIDWERVNGLADIRSPENDAFLHRERHDRGRKRLHPLPLPLATLPDGAMVQAGGESFLIVKGQPLRWTFAGYREAGADVGEAMLITPPSTLRALQAGYRPALHPDVKSLAAGGVA